MSFKHISSKYPRDRDLPIRSYRLDLFRRLRDGTFYDILDREFDDEFNGAGEAIQLKNRQPSVHVGTNLLRTVVNDSVGMLFGEGRFPVVDTADVQTRDVIRDLIKESDLVRVMRDAAFRGSIGSIAIQMRVLKTRVFFDAHETLFLTPEYDPEEPDTLIGMRERYKVIGEDLADRGYAIADDDLNAKFWFQRVWDLNREAWFQPWKVEDQDADKAFVPVEDAKRTVIHNLGFCPWVWIKNLYGGDAVDGQCTFQHAVDTCIQMDYQVSQAGRALRYAADPLLLIKEPPVESLMSYQNETPVEGGGFGVVRSASQALTINSDKSGDAKFLEIDGSGAAIVLEYVGYLRDQALETMQGNRSKPDTMNSHQGAKALEILNAPLIRLTDNLRASYGEYGLLRLLKMFQKAVVVRGAMVKVNGKAVPIEVGRVDDLSLRWGQWFAPNEEELKLKADGLSILVQNEIISRETATKEIARETDIEDIQAERALVEAEARVQDTRLAKNAVKKIPIGPDN